jgi:autotransporter-associated beta strand protein
MIRRIFCLFLFLAGGLGTGVFAGTDLWVGNTSTNWNTAANWLGNSVPAAGDSLVFTNAGIAGAGLTNDIPAGRAFAGLTFSTNASAFTIAGNAFGLIGAIANFTTNVQTINTPVILTNAGTVNAAAATILLGGNLSDNGSNCNLTITGKAVTLSGSNSFGGTLAINSGVTLTINSTNNLGSGTNLSFGGSSGSTLSAAAAVKIPGSTVITVGSGSTASFGAPVAGVLFEVAARLTGAGAVSKKSSSYSLGTVLFSNDGNNYAGDFSVGYGNTEFTSVANQGAASSLGLGASGTGGQITLGNSSSAASISYVGTNSSSTTRPLNWTASSGGLTLANNGSGTVQFLASSNFRSGSGGAATLTLGGSNTGSNVLAQIINDSFGTTTLTKSGAGTWVLAGANTFSGGVNLNGGELQVNAAENPGVTGPLGKSGVISFGGGTLQFSSANTFDYSSRFNPGGNQAYSLDCNGQTVILASTLASSNGTLTVNSAVPGGKLMLAQTNSFTGNVTVFGGTLSVSNDACLGATTNYVILNGGALSAAANVDFNYYRTAALGTNGGTLDTPAGVTMTFDGNLYDSGSGPGSLIKTGAGTLAISTYGYSTYTGNTTISNGTLSIAGYGSIGADGKLVIASGATLDVSGATGGYTLGANQTLVAGNGASFVNGKLYLGTSALALVWTNGVPSLTISGNKLVLNNNAVTITVAGGTPLPVGVYKIISKGAGGSVSGAVSTSLVNLNGAGAVAGASLQITSGELYLNVHGGTPSTAAIASSAATTAYGNPVTFTASVSPASATGVVTFTDGTTTYGTATLAGGQGSLTVAGGGISAGSYAMTAIYAGNATYAPSVSSGLTQTVTQAVLTVAANSLSRWAGNANPTLTASYVGLVAGDSISVVSGAPNLTTTATQSSPIGNYPITITQGSLTNVTGNYLLSFTNGALSVVVGAMPYPQGTAFPLMMYEVGDAPSAANVAGYGWNIIQNYGLNTNSDINNYLQLAYGESQGGAAPIPCGGDVSSNYVEWPQPEVEAWIQGSLTNDNLGCWYMPEEMRSWMPAEVRLLKDYRAWIQLYDTNGRRPTYEYTPNDRITSTQIGVVTNVDIIGTSCYCEAQGQPHAWVRYKVQQAGVQAVLAGGCTLGSNYLAGQKTVMAVLYCADAGNGQFATPPQAYHDVWSAIASGAQGIALYSYYHAVNDNPAVLANNLDQFNLAAAQISGTEIGQVILYGPQNTNVNFIITAGPTNTDSFNPGDGTNWQYSSLNVLCKTWSNNAYVIAVNSTSNYVSAVVTNLPVSSATATLPLEYRSLMVSGGGLADTFAPWGVHVYKLSLPAAAPAPAIGSISIAGGAATLGCSGTAYAGYILQRSTNLANSSGWVSVGTNSASSAGLFVFTNSLAGKAVFYRLLAQ